MLAELVERTRKLALVSTSESILTACPLLHWSVGIPNLRVNATFTIIIMVKHSASGRFDGEKEAICVASTNKAAAAASGNSAELNHKRQLIP